jgi:hypothetical protein
MQENDPLAPPAGRRSPLKSKLRFGFERSAQYARVYLSYHPYARARARRAPPAGRAVPAADSVLLNPLRAVRRWRLSSAELRGRRQNRPLAAQVR